MYRKHLIIPILILFLVSVILCNSETLLASEAAKQIAINSQLYSPDPYFNSLFLIFGHNHITSTGIPAAASVSGYVKTYYSDQTTSGNIVLSSQPAGLRCKVSVPQWPLGEISTISGSSGYYSIEATGSQVCVYFQNEIAEIYNEDESIIHPDGAINVICTGYSSSVNFTFGTSTYPSSMLDDDLFFSSNYLYHINQGYSKFWAVGVSDFIKPLHVHINFPGATAFIVPAIGVPYIAIDKTAVGAELKYYPQVIVHEYGHSLVYANSIPLMDVVAIDYPYASSRKSYERRALNEALADYYACSFYNRSMVFPVYRWLDNDYRYDRYITKNSGGSEFDDNLMYVMSTTTTPTASNDYGYEHHNSQVFSGALWHLRQKLGQSEADEIIWSAFDDYKPTNFISAYGAIYNIIYSRGGNTRMGRLVFARHGIYNDEDNIEGALGSENDSIGNAYQVSATNYNNRRCYDDDFYKINVSAGQKITCTINDFINSNGDLDLELYDSTSGAPIRSSTGTSNSETVSYTASTTKTFYIRVFGKNRGSSDFPRDVNDYGMSISLVVPTGALRVNIEPSVAGGQWRRVGTSTWFSSGYTESGIPIGNYTVEFKEISGWNKPSNIPVPISDGITTTTLVTYVRQTGSLRVTIEPEEARSSGAQWRRAGTSTWYNSGYTESGIPTGDYNVEFKSISGWNTPSNISITITYGGTATTSGTYVRQTGSLRVTIEPAEVRSSGAQWRRVGTSTWYNSGYTESGIPTGNYNVEFRSISGWNTAPNIAVTITSGGTATSSGTYVRQTGSLRVTIEPPGARDAGAQWRRVGTSTWFNSSATEGGIHTGNYTVEFKDISGWQKPSNKPVTINYNSTTTTSGTYTQQTGSLYVSIDPQGAIDAGAQWRRTGTSAWFDDGYTESGVPIGSAEVEFKEIAGWNKPSNQLVSISEGVTSNTSGTYVRETGSLRVTIEPSEARSAGAKWRRTGTSPWRDSGDTENDIPTGDYYVEFNDVSGWDKPSNTPIAISEGITSNATGTYTLQTGSLQVTIEPAEARSSGAQWRISGTTTWFNSGYTESGVAVGTATVEFKEIPDWFKPSNKTLSIQKDQTTYATGTYSQDTGSLRVTIEPVDARNAGAQWSIDGSNWYDSGFLLGDIAVGPITVQFKDLDGWDKPAEQTITIQKDVIAEGTGLYSRHLGSLRVLIEPQGAIDAVAKWRRVGTSTWFTSGQTETDIPTGEVNVEFQQVIGWSKPANQTVTIEKDATANTTGTYVQSYGSLMVMIQPQEAIDAGAKWRRVGTEIWRNSGYTESDVPIGDYYIEFYDIEGLTEPENESVTVTENQTTFIECSYSECVLNYDVNLDGSVTPGDALMAFEHYLGSKTIIDACSLLRADANGDGQITPGDALIIFKAYFEN